MRGVVWHGSQAKALYCVMLCVQCVVWCCWLLCCVVLLDVVFCGIASREIIIRCRN